MHSFQFVFPGDYEAFSSVGSSLSVYAMTRLGSSSSVQDFVHLGIGLLEGLRAHGILPVRRWNDGARFKLSILNEVQA